MMPKTDYKKMRAGTKSRIGRSECRALALTKPENIQEQLEEARFISSFMASVCSSLEFDNICSIAARALYEHAPYYRIVFAFSAGLERRTVTFSPMAQKEFLPVRPIISVGQSCSLSALHEASLVSAHINLLDDMGSIAIYHKGGKGNWLSNSLLASVAAYFSQAIRNSLEHSKMKDLAMRDGLTELFNRRIFDETLAQKVKNPNMRPVSLILIDVDNFKRVNDTFGHQAGDHVLKTVARILKESCRGHDLIARFGGEEFAIILSETQAEIAHAVAQRIKNRLAKTVFTFDGQQLELTVSMGLATCQEGSSIFTSNLVKRADHALYQAKRTGKNKICMFTKELLTEIPHTLSANRFGSLVPASC